MKHLFNKRDYFYSPIARKLAHLYGELSYSRLEICLKLENIIEVVYKL